MIRAVFLVIAITLSPVWPSVQAELVPLVPMRDFFRNPKSTGYTLSPDGTRIAYLKSWNRRLNVFVREVDSAGEIRVTSAEKRDLSGYLWAGNSRIAYIQDRAGNENYHLFVADIDGTNERELTPFENVRVTIVDELEDHDDIMLIGMNKRNPRVFDVYRVNLVTGDLTLVAENPGNIASWITDTKGRLRAAVVNDGLTTKLLYRSTEDEPFRTIQEHDFKQALEPLFFSFDDSDLYVLSNFDRNTKAVYLFDPETVRFEEMIFSHPEVDAGGLLRSKKREKITGAMYVTARRQYEFFDHKRRELQQFLEKKLSGCEVVVADMSRDERKVLVRTYTDTSMGAYYFHDRDSGVFRKLTEVSPWIDPDIMAPMIPVTYRARDGLPIHGYLTLPKRAEPENLPVVILPHGGPWVRNTWGFDSEVQFLANRGLAVLQMNFRGSTGFGKRFWTAGFEEWGRDMQNDITDGVLWLVDQGIADPERIGIYGASYGGYAVLAGLTFTPDIYACGFDYVGVSNLFTLLENIPPYWELGRKRLYRMIGHPVKDKELLHAVSPVFHAEEIEAPLFVAQGANDPRVKKIESDQIVEAVREKGVEVWYMLKKDEGHGFAKEENRFDLYRAMERFFGKYLDSRVEKVDSSG
ncbi:MAG: S9 family peptidase [Desulfovibrionales bacterium]